MGRYFALSLSLPAGVKTKSKAKPKSVTRANFGLWIMVGIVFFGFLYLFQVSSSTTKGYEVKNLERRLVELKESNRRLELETASLKSIQNLETEVKSLNLVPSDGVNYFRENKYALE